MALRTVQFAFAGGELTPEFWGRIDDAKYKMGLARGRNIIVRPHGATANRPGTRYVRTAPTVARLIPFTFSTTQTMVLEFGHHYIRFHTDGATLESSPGVAYEVATTYDSADLFSIHYTQSNDVLTLVHPNYPPQELRRLGALSWALTTISFAATLTPPGSVASSALVGSGTTDYVYVVVAVGSNGIDKSLPSASTTVANNLLVTGNQNEITWGAVANAMRYNVYKQSNGLFGYIGQTDGVSFIDENIVPDISSTPPIDNPLFLAAGNYPSAVAYYEQRRWFAGTLNQPQNFWATRSGTESDMSYSIPVRDDDALSFRAAAREANTIRHLVPLNTLVMLTSAAEWRLTSLNTDAVTPSSVSVKPQSYIGANDAQPVIVNNNLVYVADRGGHAREMAFSNSVQFSGYLTGDLSLRAPHLFDGFDIVDIGYSKAPYPIVWMVSTSGLLLSLTYVPEQQIGAWTWHDSGDAVFESCCCVAEGDEDRLYVVVLRTINGVPTRFIERLGSMRFEEDADAYFVDCGASYDGVPADTISGLSWLNGEEVSILGDGAVHTSQVVTAGAVDLEADCSKAHIGLPFISDWQTLPAAMIEVQGSGQGHIKNVNKAWLSVFRSGGIFVGPTFDLLREHKQRTTEPYGSPPAFKTDVVEIVIDPTWARNGQVCVRQTAPLPLTITSLTLEMEIGG
jgi:hypothetical protein